MYRNKKGHAGLKGLVIDLVGHLGAAPSRAFKCTDLIGGFSNLFKDIACQQ
jgi:hypothetical protein